MNTVTVLAHRRPHLLRQTLDALVRCYGLAEWRVCVVMDRPDNETRYLVQQVDPRWETVELDLGNATDAPYARVSRATLMALSLGFATSDFVVHLEEDCVPERTALAWFARMAHTYRNDPSVFTINAWSGPETGNPEPETVGPWFTPWLWGTWVDRFQEMRQGWDFEYWDRHLNERMRGDRLGVFPHRSLVRDIGREGGVNPPHEWDARMAQT